MEEEHKKFLTKHLIILSSQIGYNIHQYIIYLVSKRIFSTLTAESINTKTTKIARVLDFYLHLYRRGPKAFGEFLTAIKIYDNPFFHQLRSIEEDRIIIDEALRKREENLN